MAVWELSLCLISRLVYMFGRRLLDSRAECDLVVAGRGAAIHMVGVVGGVRIRVGARRRKLLGAGSGHSACSVGVVAAVSGGTGERVGRRAEGVEIADGADGVSACSSAWSHTVGNRCHGDLHAEVVCILYNESISAN
jgi:hypothetical protein